MKVHTISIRLPSIDFQNFFQWIRGCEGPSSFYVYFSGILIPIHLQFSGVFATTYAGTDRSSFDHTVPYSQWRWVYHRNPKHKPNFARKHWQFQPGYLQEVPRMDPPREVYLPRPHRRPGIFDRDPKWRDVDTFSVVCRIAVQLNDIWPLAVRATRQSVNCLSWIKWVGRQKP